MASGGSRNSAFTALAVVAVCIAASALVALGTGGTEQPRASTARAPAADASTATTACGSSPPFELRVPAGYGAGQLGTSSPDADTPASSLQLTVTYPSSTGSIELRWPADDAQKWEAGTLPGGATDMAALTFPRTQTQTGDTAQRSVFLLPSQPKGCQTVQVTVYDSDVNRAAAASDAITTHPVVSHVALVTSTGSAPVQPRVAPCTHPDGTTVAAQAIAAQGSGTAADARAALAAFVATNSGVPENGYTELQLPDGSFVYTAANRAGAVVVEVHVVKTTGGWTLADTTESPC